MTKHWFPNVRERAPTHYDRFLIAKLEELTGSEELAKDIMDLFMVAALEVLLETGSVTLNALGTIVLKTDQPRFKDGNLLMTFIKTKSSLDRLISVAGVTPTVALSRLMTEPMLKGLTTYYNEAMKRVPEEFHGFIDETKRVKEFMAETEGLTEYDPSRVSLETLVKTARFCFENNLIDAFRLVDIQVRMCHSGVRPMWFYQRELPNAYMFVRIEQVEDYELFLSRTISDYNSDVSSLSITRDLNKDIGALRGFNVPLGGKDLDDSVQLD